MTNSRRTLLWAAFAVILIYAFLLFLGCNIPFPPIPQPTPTPTPPPPTTTTTTTLPPVPPPPSCSAPQGVSWQGPGPVLISTGPVLNRTMEELTGCSQGTDCRVPSGDNQQAWLQRVAAALRAKGLCAGQQEAGVTDEIGVATQCGGPWESWHAYNCTPRLPTDPPDTDTCILPRGKVVWAPGAARPSWIPASGCSSAPPPTTTPPPPITLPPTPPPGPSCAAPAPETWHIIMKPWGGPNSGVLDSTPEAGWFNIPPPQPPLQNCRAHFCELSAEKGNFACAQVLYGEPVYKVLSGDLTIQTPFDPGSGPNPYMAKRTGGSGVLQLCGSADVRSCVKVQVQPSGPACKVITSGGETGHCELLP